MPSLIESFEYTTRASVHSNGPYHTVYAPDGTYVSRHTSLEEASESAQAHATASGAVGSVLYRIVSPEKHMTIKLLAPAGGNGGGAQEPDITPPGPPVGGFLNNFASGSVRLNWTNDGANDIHLTRIYKSTTSAVSGFSLLATVAFPTAQYTDSAYNNAAQAWYRLTHVDNAQNESAFGNTFTDITAPSAPAAPTVLSRTSSSITITLPATSALDHASFRVYRSNAGGGTPTVLVQAGVTSSTYTITGLVASTSYDIAVEAVDVSGNRSTLGSSVPGTTNAATNEPYDLTAGGTRTPPAWVTSTFAWPTAPTPSASPIVDVASAAAFTSAAGVNGARVRVTANFSGSVTVSGDDVEIICYSGSTHYTITGNLTFSGANRVKWTGGTVIGQETVGNSNDILFVNYRRDSGATTNDINAGNNQRIAYVNCRLTNNQADRASDWAAHTAPALGGWVFNDILYANCFIDNLGGGQVARHTSVTRLIIVDSIVGYASSTNSSRIHGSDYVWFADSITIGESAQWNPVGTITFGFTNGTIERVTRYGKRGTNQPPTWLANMTSTTTGTARDCRLYDAWGRSGTLNLVSLTPLGTNDVVPWDGTTLPSTAGYGADH